MMEGMDRLIPLDPFPLDTFPLDPFPLDPFPLTIVEQVTILDASISFKISSSPLSVPLTMSGFLESLVKALASALICSLLCLFRFFRTFRNPRKILTLRKTSKIKGTMTVVMVQVQ